MTKTTYFTIHISNRHTEGDTPYPDIWMDTQCWGGFATLAEAESEIEDCARWLLDHDIDGEWDGGSTITHPDGTITALAAGEATAEYDIGGFSIAEMANEGAAIAAEDLLDIGDIAVRLGVKATSLRAMLSQPERHRRIDGIPAPIRYIGNAPVWDAGAVTRWLLAGNPLAQRLAAVTTGDTFTAIFYDASRAGVLPCAPTWLDLHAASDDPNDDTYIDTVGGDFDDDDAEAAFRVLGWRFERHSVLAADAAAAWTVTR